MSSTKTLRVREKKKSFAKTAQKVQEQEVQKVGQEKNEESVQASGEEKDEKGIQEEKKKKQQQEKQVVFESKNDVLEEEVEDAFGQAREGIEDGHF